MKRFMRVWVVILMIVIGSAMAGCSGGGADVRTQTTTTTLGQELKDLEEAYKKGIITQQQYEESKKRLIEQRTQQ
jgi:hypothetical protein